MVGKTRTTCKQTRKLRVVNDLNVIVESQECVAKSNKESIVSKGRSKEDGKVPGKAQEDSAAKKDQDF
eukprot:3419065-Ditylum_brightwellii.AAC.1